MLNENLLNEYSLEEKKIGRWIDGRPIYSKTMMIDLDSNENTVLVDHNIKDIERCIYYTGNYKNGNEMRFLPQVYYTQEDFYLALYTVTNTSLRIYYGNWVKEHPGTKVYITLYYIKTTD